jgi:DNA-directed RNA polymerase subunit alpha
MQIMINLNSLTHEEQKKIYLALKEKFENHQFAKEVEVTSEQLMDMELTEFEEISTHIFNILKFARIHTVRALIQTSKENLESLRGFGKRSMDQVEQFLQERGLSLK